MSDQINDGGPALIRMLQCGKKSCSHIFTDDEHVWLPGTIGKRACCPLCHNGDYYTLKENGQKMTMQEREPYRKGIDPNAIEPTAKMGPKMRLRLERVKVRSLDMLAARTSQSHE